MALRAIVFFLGFGILFSEPTCAFVNRFNSSKVRVDIMQGGPQEIGASTSCKPQLWGGSTFRSCLCCLIKSSIRPQGLRPTGAEIPRCQAKGQCSRQDLTQIAGGQTDYKDIVNTVIKDYTLIKDYTSSQPTDLQPQAPSYTRSWLRPGEATVTINQKTIRLTRSTSCRPEKWGGNLEAGCACCITKYSLTKRGLDPDLADGAYQKCLNTGRCYAHVLPALVEAYGLKNPRIGLSIPTQLVNKISLPIKVKN